MTSSNNEPKKFPVVAIKIDSRHKMFEDLARQVVGDMRARVTNLREETGGPVTQAELARALGVDRSSISKILNTTTNLTLRKISDFAAATGSTCYFRMARDPNSEIYDDVNLSYQVLRDSGKKSEKSRGFDFDDMLCAARKYIRDLVMESGLVDNNQIEGFRVDPMDDTWDSWLPFDDDSKTRCGICIRLGSEGDGDIVILFIVAEFTFADGFSEIEWVLYDVSGLEHFRSRDLRQVAQLAVIVLVRGGFH